MVTCKAISASAWYPFSEYYNSKASQAHVAKGVEQVNNATDYILLIKPKRTGDDVQYIARS